MMDNLEKILEKSRTGTLESADLIRGFELISRGDELQLRDPTGALKAVAGVVAWPVKKALIKDDKTYDSAQKLLDAIAAETVAGGVPTHSAVVANLYSFFIDYDRNMKSGDRNAVSGKRAVARTNYEEAITAATLMQELVNAHMPANRRLKGYLADKKAAAMTKAGNYQEAFDEINTPELANDENAAFKRGQIAYDTGQFAAAANNLRIVYDRNPKRQGVAEMLAKTYERLASVTDPATTDTTGIDAAVVTAWNQAMDLLGKSGTAAQRQKIMEVINGIGDTAANANEKSMLARAYHALAVVDRRGRNYGAAIGHLITSIGILGTPEAYTNLAETHGLIASSYVRQAR